MKQLLFPFSWLYRMIIVVRNFLYDSKVLKQHEFGLPVISVGNITIGGTGKTPHAEYIIELLKDHFHVVYLSRGYKRKTKGFRLGQLNSSPDEIGDEAVQIKQKYPKITVAVCEKRVKGLKKLLANSEQKMDVVVLDDAFQHRSIKPNINILLVDYTRPLHDDRLLPVGLLREPATARYRANMIVYTKCPNHLQPIEQRIIKNKLNIRPYQDLFFTSIVYDEITPAIQGSQLFSDDMKRYHVLLITGIANPAPLVEHLKAQVGQITHRSFPDHHRYTTKEIFDLAEEFEKWETRNKIIITTEKDLARIRFIGGLPEHFLEKLFYIPITVRFLNKTKDQFNRKIKDYVTENKSNSKLHKR